GGRRSPCRSPSRPKVISWSVHDRRPCSGPAGKVGTRRRHRFHRIAATDFPSFSATSASRAVPRRANCSGGHPPRCPCRWGWLPLLFGWLVLLCWEGGCFGLRGGGVGGRKPNPPPHYKYAPPPPPGGADQRPAPLGSDTRARRGSHKDAPPATALERVA